MSIFGTTRKHTPGTLVPSATKAMALTESLRKMKHPRCPATSPMMAVQNPIIRIETTKVKYPLNIAAKVRADVWWQHIKKGEERKERRVHKIHLASRDARMQVCVNKSSFLLSTSSPSLMLCRSHS